MTVDEEIKDQLETTFEEEITTQEVTKSINEQYADQFRKVDSFSRTMRNRLRTRMMELENQFHKDKLMLQLRHEAEEQELFDKHTAQMDQLGAMLNKMGKG